MLSLLAPTALTRSPGAHWRRNQGASSSVTHAIGPTKVHTGGMMRFAFQTQASECRGLGVFAIAVGSLLTIGCHTAPKPIAAAPCVGTPYLLVRNATGGAVDVFYSGATAYLVGTAGPGPTELTLPPSVDPKEGYFRARRPDGQWIVAAFGGQREASRITFQVRCR